ncbi:DNA polymerase subunit beta, partial [Kitasatospora sp. NPDC059571]|uniref:DNA polymerase subunit beta n=1 Tax=Kitasatospora sp. NPDC059571 TaxID=3346871 RepID=UPI00367DD53D
RTLGAQAAGRPVEATEPGGWGSWVDGGSRLEIGGVRVDRIYRDLGRVRACWARAREGRFEDGFRTGHPLGFRSTCYVGELALGRILADPSGEMAGLRAEITAGHPAALRAAVLASARFVVPFLLANAAEAPHDTAYLHGCLFRVAGVLAQALHTRAGQWLINEKGAVDAAGRLPGAPRDFARRAHGLFRAGAATALAEAARPADEVLRPAT